MQKLAALGHYRNAFEYWVSWGSETVKAMVAVFNNRKQTSSALLVISTGIFLLAVLFSMVPDIGFYVSLALLVLGCFSMITVGILRETSAKAASLSESQKITVQESDEFYS
jgi:hypothetical protein